MARTHFKRMGRDRGESTEMDDMFICGGMFCVGVTDRSEAVVVYVLGSEIWKDVVL